jgi:hypothetical protein
MSLLTAVLFLPRKTKGTAVLILALIKMLQYIRLCPTPLLSYLSVQLTQFPPTPLMHPLYQPIHRYKTAIPFFASAQAPSAKIHIHVHTSNSLKFLFFMLLN